MPNLSEIVIKKLEMSCSTDAGMWSKQNINTVKTLNSKMIFKTIIHSEQKNVLRFGE